MPKPIVASFCTTFLKPEMLHIYRQITGLDRYRTFVLARHRSCEDRYPFEDVEVLDPNRKFNFVHRFYLKYIRKMPPLYYRGEFHSLVGVMNRRHADLMHIYFGHTGVHLLDFIYAWERPCVVSFHGADVRLRDNDKEYHDRMKALFRASSLVLARSSSLAERLKEMGCPAEKIRLNRTGIPLDEFPFAHRMMPTDGEWHLVQACRLIAKKGLGSSLQAFKKFRQKYPKARFTIAGSGEMQEELVRLTHELGVADAVEFVGFLNAAQLNALYATAHIFLHPSEMTSDSNQEGIPNSMLEAMATGLPVVATMHGGIPEAVSHERSGLLVPEHDPDALCAALEQVTESSEYLQVMGRQASESVIAEFESGQAIKRLEMIYDEALRLGKPAVG